MSFYIRYVSADDRPIAVGELEHALRQVDPSYAIDGDLISLGELACGIIDVTQRGDPICDGDIELLMRFAESKKYREEILDALRAAKCIVCVQPVNTNDPKAANALTPAWDWLLANRAGILVWEGGHFFTSSGELK